MHQFEVTSMVWQQVTTARLLPIINYWCLKWGTEMYQILLIMHHSHTHWMNENSSTLAWQPYCNNNYPLSYFGSQLIWLYLMYLVYFYALPFIHQVMHMHYAKLFGLWKYIIKYSYFCESCCTQIYSFYFHSIIWF